MSFQCCCEEKIAAWEEGGGEGGGRGGITREGEAIYRATLESLLASTGWTPRAAEEMAREEQRAHVRQMRWAREHGRGEPVRCFDAEEYDEGDDAFDALFDGGSGYGWDSPSGGGAFF